MADGEQFQGGEELYKRGRQEQDPKQLAEIVKQYRELLKANKDLDKVSNKQSKSLSAQEKNLERLEKRLITLRTKAVDPVAKALESLTTRFTGGSGLNQALTRFAGTSAESLFHVDKLNDKVSIFGRTLDMSATSLLRYLGAIQLVIAATLKYLEFQDEAQRKQGQLMRSFGQTNISIATTYRMAAQGWRVAGSTGAEAAQQLNQAISRARMQGAEEFLQAPDTDAVEDARKEYERLLKLTTGLSARIPEFVTRLSESFAVRDQNTVVNQLEEIAALALKAGAPIDQLTGMIFDLGEQFAYLGMTVQDSQGMIAEFADAIGKRGMAPAIGLTVAAQAAAEFQTAAGVPGIGKTAYMIGRQFEQLPENLQELVGGRQFLQQDVYQQMEKLYTLTQGQYSAIKSFAGYQQLQEIRQTRGLPAAMAAAPELTGLEFRTLEQFFEKVTPGVVDVDELAAQYQKLLEESKDEKATTEDVVSGLDATREELSAHLNIISDLQKEWYSNIVGAIQDVKGTFIEVMTGERGIREGVEEAVTTAIGPEAAPETQAAAFSVATAVGLGPVAGGAMLFEKVRDLFRGGEESAQKGAQGATTAETEVPGNELRLPNGAVIQATTFLNYREDETPEGTPSHSQIYKPKD